MTQNQSIPLDQLRQTSQRQAISMLFNPGLEVELVETLSPAPAIAPLPKFQPGEKVGFTITLCVTAVIDEVNWDEIVGGYYYSVKESKVHTEELDTELNPDIYVNYLGDVLIDEGATIISEHRLLKPEIPPQDLVSADYRPSCEFDPN